jgi:hypothetical protein
MRSDPQALGVLLTGEALRTAQQNVVIAAMRRPTLGSSMKEAGLSERHFPRDLRAAFNIAMTNSQGRNPAARSGQGPSDLATVWKEDHRME